MAAPGAERVAPQYVLSQRSGRRIGPRVAPVLPLPPVLGPGASTRAKMSGGACGPRNHRESDMSKKPKVGRHDNSGKAWSLTDIAGLADCILQGTSIRETAVFLYRDVGEVRAKIAELKARRQCLSLGVPFVGAGCALTLAHQAPAPMSHGKAKGAGVTSSNQPYPLNESWCRAFRRTPDRHITSLATSSEARRSRGR
jgi:hypothetical protein